MIEAAQALCTASSPEGALANKVAHLCRRRMRGGDEGASIAAIIRLLRNNASSYNKLPANWAFPWCPAIRPAQDGACHTARV